MIKERFRPHCSDEMVDAVYRLFYTMLRMAAMEGSRSEMILYPTLETEYQAASLFEFLGCTLLAVTSRARSTTTNEIVHIVTAHPDAVTCALIAYMMLEQLDELFCSPPQRKTR